MPGNQTQPLSVPYVSWDWGRLVVDRHAALETCLRRRSHLDPRQVLAVASCGAPRVCVQALRRLIAARGWNEPGAHLSFDVLDRDAVLRELHPAQREWVRLALFGPRGEGLTHENKHRQAVYDRLCASILRETNDIPTLQAAAARVLNDPEVRSDPTLAGMLNGFVAQRESEVRAREYSRARQWETQGTARPVSTVAPRKIDKEAERRRVQKAATRLLLQLEETLAHYDLGGARRTVDELKRLNKLHPDVLKQSDIYGSEARVAQLADRLPAFRVQLKKLSEEGAAAAASGDANRAHWISRRLSALHDMLPEVLPTSVFEGMRDEVLAGVASFENKQVHQEIIAEEQAVIREIKHLAAMVHRFYKVEKRLGHDSPVYKQAEKAYREAVAAVFEHDREWLASLMMKLDSLLEDLDDPQGHANAQVDQFLEKVRVALVRLRKGIRSHDGLPPGGN